MSRILPRHHSPAPAAGRTRRPLADRLRGLLALLALLALLVGVPTALIALRGNPLPDAELNAGALLDVLTRPDDGSLFLAALTWVAWIGWASFAVSVLVEVPAQLRGLPSPHLPALGLQQRTASALVAGATLLFTVPLTVLANPALAEPAPAAAIPASSTATPRATTDAAPRAENPPTDPNAGSTTSPAAPTYTVLAGDSLWQIAADRLGDGARYLEIAQLNYGALQPDGLQLTTDHWLRPGWTLTLPADATVSPLDTAPAGQVVVEPGDTLWNIAAETLGDGSRYDEIAAASTGLQSDGDRLTDPDLIRPGWQLTIPGAAKSPSSAPPDQPTQLPVEPHVACGPLHPPTAEQPASTTGSLEQDTGGTDHTAPADATGTDTAGTRAAGTDAEASGDLDDSDLADVVRTAGGVGALLAAGLLALLGARRVRQQRQRRPGQRIAMPPAELAPTELDLRLVENPDALARVDQTLRTLSALLGEADRSLPPLRLVRLHAEQLELYLAVPATLPAPFTGTADPTVWILDSDAPLLPTAELTNVPAPYPSLVTIGHDLDDAHVLVDLEHLGALAIDGDAERSIAVLAALAAELATSRWADDLQVTLVGCLPTLPAALGTGRVRHVPSLEELLPALEHRATDVRSALGSQQLDDLLAARTTAPQYERPGDAWTPEIVLVAGTIDPLARARLDKVLHHLPRAGVAAVTTAPSEPSEWTLRLNTDSDADAVAVLAPINLTLRPQVLTSTDLNQLLGLIAVADQPPTSPASDAPAMDTHEPAVRELGSHLGSDLEPQNDVAATSTAPVAFLPVPSGPPPARDTADTQADGDNTSSVENSAGLDIAGKSAANEAETAEAVESAPLVQVLGPVEIRDARGPVEQSKRRQLTEIAAFLALHPGADHHGLSEAIWPGARAVENTRNTALSKLRRWLGADDGGDDYVPRVVENGYRLHPHVRTDWHRWQELLPGGPEQASTATLAAALDLVRGKPFAGVNPRRYAWAEPDRQEMISAIVDVAHELALRALLDGNAPLARRAAAAGLHADPGAELLWRDALKAEWLAGDLTGLATTADRLSALADELGDDLEPETLELLDELLGRPTRRQVGT
jgi:nucleoid-associated protein YgaU